MRVPEAKNKQKPTKNQKTDVSGSIFAEPGIPLTRLFGARGTVAEWPRVCDPGSSQHLGCTVKSVCRSDFVSGLSTDSTESTEPTESTEATEATGPLRPRCGSQNHNKINWGPPELSQSSPNPSKIQLQDNSFYGTSCGVWRAATKRLRFMLQERTPKKQKVRNEQSPEWVPVTKVLHPLYNCLGSVGSSC